MILIVEVTFWQITHISHIFIFLIWKSSYINFVSYEYMYILQTAQPDNWIIQLCDTWNNCQSHTHLVPLIKS